MPTLLVVHHTPSPALQAMFEAAVSGARTDEVEGVEVVIRPALTAAAADVLTADGYLLGTPGALALVTLWERELLLYSVSGRVVVSASRSNVGLSSRESSRLSGHADVAGRSPHALARVAGDVRGGGQRSTD
jgi:hypothetical protein